MSPGGISDTRFFRLVMISCLLILLVSPYTNILQSNFHTFSQNEMFLDSSVIVNDQENIISELATAPLEFDNPVTFELNSTVSNNSFTINIPEPGFLTINWSFEVLAAGFPGPDFEFWINESAVKYVPQLDQSVPDEKVRNPPNLWYELMPGFTFQEENEIFAVNSGYLDLDFDLRWESTIDNVTVTLETSWVHSFGNPPLVSSGQNFSLEWMADDTWESVVVHIPEDGLYNIEVESCLPYDISSSYAGPSDIHVPERVIFLSKPKGVHNVGVTTYKNYYPNHFVTIGSSGTSVWTDDDIVQLYQGEYYVLGVSGSFTHLNGTSTNFTMNVKPFSTIRLDPNESIDLNFNIMEPETTYLVAAYVPDGNLSTIRFTNPTGGNWTVSSKHYPSMSSAVPTLTYMKYPYSELTTEVRYDDIFFVSTAGALVGSTIRTTLVTGEPWGFIYQPIGFSSFYTDGELTSYITSMSYTVNPYPILIFEVSATPAAGIYSDTFDVTMQLDAVPFEELDENPHTASFNATQGSVVQLYRFPVKSGYTYNITANPTEYTSEGSIAFAVLPSVNLFDQWTITDPPLFVTVESDSPYYSILTAQTINRTASVKLLAAIDGEIFIYGAGSGLLPGDCTEAEFRVEETPPAILDFGDSVPLLTEELDFFCHEVNLIDGYEYRLTIQLHPAQGEVSVTFFDDDGVNPFATTEEEIWLEADSSVYLYKTFTLNSHHSGVAYMGLILEGNVTIIWDVVDTTPPELSIISPSEGSIYEPGTLTIEFSAEDDIELKQLNISIGDDVIPLNLTATSYDWVIDTEGVYVILLTAEDTHGNIAGSQVIVIIELESYLSMELLLLSGFGTFGGVLVIGILVSRRRGGM